MPPDLRTVMAEALGNRYYADHHFPVAFFDDDCERAFWLGMADVAINAFAEVPEHVIDRNNDVWRVVRDGGMLTRATYTGITTIGIAVAERDLGPMRPVYSTEHVDV